MKSACVMFKSMVQGGGGGTHGLQSQAYIGSRIWIGFLKPQVPGSGLKVLPEILQALNKIIYITNCNVWCMKILPFYLSLYLFIQQISVNASNARALW